jgi:uncharacterized membrane protein
MSDRTPDGRSLPKARTEAFSDGVIAIIVTVLVLEVRVPALSGEHLDAQLLEALWQALPLVGAYGVSFMVLLAFWVAHHHLLHSMQRVDRNFLWLNGLFLMMPAFVPADAARRAVRKGLLSPTLYVAGAALAGVDTRLAWAVDSVVPLIFIVPGAFEWAAHRLQD